MEGNTEGQRLNQGRPWLLAVLLLGALLLASIITFLDQFRTVPLRPSPETTLYFKPLRSDGQVDYFEVLRQKRIADLKPDETNGYRKLLENIDFVDDDRGHPRQLFFAAMGIPANHQPMHRFENIDLYLDRSLKAFEHHQLDEIRKRVDGAVMETISWTSEDMDDLRFDLSRRLKRLVEAT